MLPRPPTCCRLVQRPLHTAPDSIWISDEILATAFRQFCAPSTTARRHGSSVPGPMESRRRLGRRRLTHLSEAIPTPLSRPGHIWNLLGAADRTQWRWEAPKLRPARKESDTNALPAWLSEWDTTPQETVEDLRVEMTEEKCSVAGEFTVEEDVRSFREMIRSEPDAGIQIGHFNARLKQSLTLGLVPSEMLSFILQRITEDLRESSKNLKLAQARCVAFYNVVWDGISASKVLRPVDFEGKILNEIVYLLSGLPSTSEVQSLAHSILCSASTPQFQYMDLGIISLVKKWSHNWLEAPCIGDYLSVFRTAEDSVVNAKTKLTDAYKIVAALEKGSKSEKDFAMVRDAVSVVHIAIYQALVSIGRVEQIFSPFKSSSKMLADALQNIPHNLFLRVASSCLENIMMVCSGRGNHLRTIRYYWLSTMAQIPKVDTELFLQTWKALETRGDIPENEASDLMLNHWISRGYVRNGIGVRNSFEATAQRVGREDFASLLFALDKHRENSLTRTRELFLLLDKLGKYRKVYKILSRMNDLGLKVPMSCLGRSIDTMSNYDARLALKTFYLHKAMLLGDRRVRLDWIPNFIIALINDRSVTPKQIWGILRIPIYEELPRSQRHFQATPLSQTMIALLHKMAFEFAHSEARPTRVALRNVLQCLYHLRVHRAPISQELSRAMSRAGISEDINNGQWIRDERLRYTLHLIKEIEGEDVAEKVDATVLNWREFLSEKQARHYR
jgi:hypothetical protein